MHAVLISMLNVRSIGCQGTDLEPLQAAAGGVALQQAVLVAGPHIAVRPRDKRLVTMHSAGRSAACFAPV